MQALDLTMIGLLSQHSKKKHWPGCACLAPNWQYSGLNMAYTFIFIHMH